MEIAGSFGGMLIAYLDRQMWSESLIQEIQTLKQELQAYLEQASGQAAKRLPLKTWIAYLERTRKLAVINTCSSSPALGLAIGAEAQIAHMGIMGYLGQSCASIGAALSQFEHFARLVYDVNSLSISIHGDRVITSWGSEHIYPGQLADETAIASFVTLIRRIAGQDIQPTRVNFINPAPDDLQPYEDFFHCPVTFGGIRTTVECPVEYLAIPLQSHDQSLQVLLASHAEAMLNTLPSDAFERQFRQLITDTILRQEQPSLAYLAEQMHTSGRTLQRRLQAHGILLQEQVDAVRLSLFQQYVQSGRHGLAEIADALGYSDQSALTRAVKRWTGDVPKHLKGKA